MDDNRGDQEKDDFGLNKDRRLVARRERREEDYAPEPLDPVFPYRVIEVEGYIRKPPSRSIDEFP
jgi:hypothetical protein